MLDTPTEPDWLQEALRQVGIAEPHANGTASDSATGNSSPVNGKPGGAPSAGQVMSASEATTSNPPGGKPADATPSELHEEGRAEAILGHGMTSAYLATIIQPGATGPFSANELQNYRTEFLKRSRVLDDPIEISLVETYVLLQHAVGKLLTTASDIRNVPAIEATCGAATKFTAELRRFAMSIQAYRTSRRALLGIPKSSQPTVHDASNVQTQPSTTPEYTNGSSDETDGNRNRQAASHLGRHQSQKDGTNGKSHKAVA